MKFFIALVWVLIFGGCTTLDQNSKALIKACKSGVSKYDDGVTNFECKDSFPTVDRPHDQGRK